ncbi:hypothetical protein [Bradyrhizobium sp. RT3a]|uniref:hypothetical protein n=1 Tax=unclassified Bradyrhizobium TaxID=2631580 RepID=UPI0033972D4F
MTATPRLLVYLWQTTEAACLDFRATSVAMKAMFNVPIEGAADWQIEKLIAKIRVVEEERQRQLMKGDTAISGSHTPVKPAAAPTRPMAATTTPLGFTPTRVPLRRPVAAAKASAVVGSEMPVEPVAEPVEKDLLTATQAELMAHVAGETLSVVPDDAKSEVIVPAAVEPEKFDEPALTLQEAAKVTLAADQQRSAPVQHQEPPAAPAQALPRVASAQPRPVASHPPAPSQDGFRAPRASGLWTTRLPPAEPPNTSSSSTAAKSTAEPVAADPPIIITRRPKFLEFLDGPDPD